MDRGTPGATANTSCGEVTGKGNNTRMLMGDHHSLDAAARLCRCPF